MSTDDQRPTPRAPRTLPPAARKARIAANRPAAAAWCIVFCMAIGGVTAGLITIAAVGLGETTAFFSLFTVPLGMSIGIIGGGSAVDNATRPRYR